MNSGADQPEVADSLVVVGKIGAPYGVRGWVKVQSYTDPKTGILDYSHWMLQRQRDRKYFTLSQGKPHGKTLVASLEGVDDRDAAALLTGRLVLIEREALPPLHEGHYWADLIGMRVVNSQGIEFGQVERLLETGANDVLVVQGERERLIPWIEGQAIQQIDSDQRLIIVDWDADF